MLLQKIDCRLDKFTVTNDFDQLPLIDHRQTNLLWPCSARAAYLRFNPGVVVHASVSMICSRVICAASGFRDWSRLPSKMDALCRPCRAGRPGQAVAGHHRRWAHDEYFPLPSAAGHRRCVSNSLSVNNFYIMIWSTAMTGGLQSGYGVGHQTHRKSRLIEHHQEIIGLYRR